MALGSYCIIYSVVMLAGNRFKPEGLRTALSYGLMAWVLSAFVLWVGLRSIGTAQVPIKIPFMDLLAYSGYSFVHISWSIFLGLTAGKLAYYLSWMWGSTCMALFIVKTMKRIIFAEA